MVVKKGFWIFIGLVVLILIVAVVAMLRLPEDSWIKDERGVYVEHGNPGEETADVQAQKTAIVCAYGLLDSEKQKGVEINSQCLGACGAYAVDIAHSPRLEEDNLAENQCEDYRMGRLKHFIEIDGDGNLVRVV